MREWHGEERDEKHGRYGYMRNENAKWDWFAIGGRWRGLLLIKPATRFNQLEVDGGSPQTTEGGLGKVSWVFSEEFHKGTIPGNATEVDYCRADDLDWLHIDQLTRERTNKFWAEVDDFLAGKKFDGYYDGPRETMLALGMLACKDANELTGGEFWTWKWPRQNTPGVDRYDVVATKPDREALEARALAHHCPVTTFARLDASGWSKRWWDASTATPESNEAHDRDFVAWLKSGDQRDWIVVVDCHI
jgi:hypothetical protein